MSPARLTWAVRWIVPPRPAVVELPKACSKAVPLAGAMLNVTVAPAGISSGPAVSWYNGVPLVENACTLRYTPLRARKPPFVTVKLEGTAKLAFGDPEDCTAEMVDAPVLYAP